MARFDFDDLLKKDQKELDKIKTALEIHQSEDKYAFERKKFRSENFRFFIIAVLTAVISLGTQYLLDSNRHENTVQEKNQELTLKQFKDMEMKLFDETNFDRRTEKICDLAKFNNSIQDTNIAKAIQEYKNDCEQRSMVTNIKITDEMKDSTQKMDSIQGLLQVRKQQLKSAPKNEKGKLNREITDLNNQLVTVVKNVPELKPFVDAADSIEKNVEQMQVNKDNKSKPLLSNEKPISKSQVTWFKEGYFLQFDSYRIYLKKINKNIGILVSVCKTSDAGDCITLVTQTPTWIKFDSPYMFRDSGHTYRINLETIDHAGKNPFTLAGYITFETIN